jgi:hypothetical protein
MRKTLTVCGLVLAAIIALAAYPHIQVDAGKILITDGRIQFESAEPSDPLKNRLVGYWPLDDDILDYSGNNHNGYLIGAPTQTVGKVNGAYAFSVTNYIGVSNTAALNVSTALTFAAWVYRTSSASMGIAAKRVQGSDNSYELWHLATDIPTFSIWVSNAQTAVESTNTVLANNWGYIVGTYNGAEMNIYVNGVKSASTITKTGPIDTTTDRFNIGMSYNTATYGYIGTIDEVALWNRALSAEEIAELYNSGNGKSLK